MKNIYPLLLAAFTTLALTACSEEAEETISDNSPKKSENVIVGDKTMKTIQQSKNMDRFLQDSVDQKAKELDKY